VSANLDRVAAFMRELTDVVGTELREEFHMTEDRAVAIGLRCAQRVCREFRGQLIYVPIGFALRISERDQAMYDEYCRDGRDVAALAKKFDVSVQTAYKRIRLVEAGNYATRQGALFEPTD
jgi:Mor family transcriptional regulator